MLSSLGYLWCWSVIGLELGLGISVWVYGYGFLGYGFRVLAYGLGFMVYGLDLGLGSRVKGQGSMVLGYQCFMVMGVDSVLGLWFPCGYGFIVIMVMVRCYDCGSWLRLGLWLWLVLFL